MADTLALEYFYNRALTRLAVFRPTLADVTRFGWREPTKQLAATNRITWVPGTPTGKAGNVGPVKYPGRNPRSLGTLDELFTVYIVGFDATAPHNEMAQWRATRFLYDSWFASLQWAAQGQYAVISQDWELSKNEYRAGATLVVVAAVQSMIPDLVRTPAPVDVHGHIATTELGITETFDEPEVTGTFIQVDGSNFIQVDGSNFIVIG